MDEDEVFEVVHSLCQWCAGELCAADVAAQRIWCAHGDDAIDVSDTTTTTSYHGRDQQQESAELIEYIRETIRGLISSTESALRSTAPSGEGTLWMFDVPDVRFVLNAL